MALYTPEQLKVFYRSAAWRRTRTRVIARDGETCQRCGEPGRSVHHIVALNDGGAPLDDENCVTLCRPCHGLLDGPRSSNSECNTRYFTRKKKNGHRGNLFLDTVLNKTAGHDR